MEKSIKLKFKESEYVVKFPNPGQSIEIQTLKHALAEDKYGEMARSGLKLDSLNLDMIDTIATLQILIPELKEELSVKNYLSIDAFKMKELIVVYKKQFFPWYNSLLQELYKFGEDEEGTIEKE